MNAVVRPTLGDGGRVCSWSRRPARRYLGLLPWAGAATVAMAAVLRFQVRLRAPLTWDEASRVDGGAVLEMALSRGSPGRLWDWVSALDQPFVAPALHGLALVAVDDPAVAAWLPSAMAFALSGVLAAMLAASLGAGRAGAWVAAVFVWTTPIGARLAAGAFTENLGACLLAGTVLAVGRLRRQPSAPAAAACAALVALAWWTSPDYGLTSAAVLAAGRAGTGARHWRLNLLSVALVTALVAAEALATGSAGRARRALWALLGDGWSIRDIDPLYYPRALFDRSTFAANELGLAPVVAAALVAGVVWGAVSWRRRPDWRVPVLAVGAWVAVYAPAAVKGARFVTLVVPVLAALAAAAARELVALRPALQGRRRAAAAGVALVVGALVVPVQVGDQLSGFGRQLWFVQPNDPAARALAFVEDRLPASGSRPVVLIGATSALSPRLLQLAWDRRLGRRSAGVHLVPEAEPPARRRRLDETLTVLRPALVVTARAGSSSRLSPERTARGEERFPSQRDYARLADELAGRGELEWVASMTFDDDPVRIDLWRVPDGSGEAGDDA